MRIFDFSLRGGAFHNSTCLQQRSVQKRLTLRFIVEDKSTCPRRHCSLFSARVLTETLLNKSVTNQHWRVRSTHVNPESRVVILSAAKDQAFITDPSLRTG